MQYKNPIVHISQYFLYSLDDSEVEQLENLDSIINASWDHLFIFHPNWIYKKAIGAIITQNVMMSYQISKPKILDQNLLFLLDNFSILNINVDNWIKKKRIPQIYIQSNYFNKLSLTLKTPNRTTNREYFTICSAPKAVLYIAIF